MPSDQEVYIAATDLGTYPDVTVLCAPGTYPADFPQSLVNPILLVEVLSPSTEAYDGTWRLTTVRGLESVLRLPSVDVGIPLAEIYENLDLVAPDGIEEASPHPPAAGTAHSRSQCAEREVHTALLGCSAH
jgi:hypothetical protein